MRRHAGELRTAEEVTDALTLTTIARPVAGFRLRELYKIPDLEEDIGCLRHVNRTDEARLAKNIFKNQKIKGKLEDQK
jgi:hypothetical protein